MSYKEEQKMEELFGYGAEEDVALDYDRDNYSESHHYGTLHYE